jgi:hypothetical protein
MMTAKPSLARRSATAAPMPRVAPVTTATFLVCSLIFDPLNPAGERSAPRDADAADCAAAPGRSAHALDPPCEGDAQLDEPEIDYGPPFADLRQAAGMFVTEGMSLDKMSHARRAAGSGSWRSIR